MIILVKLIFAHLLGDFLFQPKTWIKEKEKKKWASPKLYIHILIHAALTLIALGGLVRWKEALIIAITHGAVDVCKLHFQKESNKVKWFLADQTMHFFVILIVWGSIMENSSEIIGTIASQNFLIYTVGIYFLTQPSAIILSTLMHSWTKSITDENKGSLPNAGRYIGMLERLFVFCFIVTGHWEAVGFLLTAKSVFRFGDLKKAKDRKMTEYVLIGTMLSFGLAISVALLANSLHN